MLHGRDRHLDFWVSLVVEDRPRPDVTCSTAVRLHNGMGKVYFALVRPFHWLIVRAALERAARGERNRHG